MCQAAALCHDTHQASHPVALLARCKETLDAQHLLVVVVVVVSVVVVVVVAAGVVVEQQHW